MYDNHNQEDYSYMYPQMENMDSNMMNPNSMFPPYDMNNMDNMGHMGNMMMPSEPKSEEEACQMAHMCQHMGYMYLAEACRIQAMYCCNKCKY